MKRRGSLRWAAKKWGQKPAAKAISVAVRVFIKVNGYKARDDRSRGFAAAMRWRPFPASVSPEWQTIP